MDTTTIMIIAIVIGAFAFLAFKKGGCGCGPKNTKKDSSSDGQRKDQSSGGCCGH